MKRAKLKGWNRDSTTQRLGATKQCDLARRGFTFTCTQLFLPAEQVCVYCKTVQAETVKS